MVFAAKRLHVAVVLGLDECVRVARHDAAQRLTHGWGGELTASLRDQLVADLLQCTGVRRERQRHDAAGLLFTAVIFVRSEQGASDG